MSGVVYGTSSETLCYENGERVFPCPCGETHRGPWAIYDYGHHICPHDSPLYKLDAEDGHYLCPNCGKSFWLADERTDGGAPHRRETLSGGSDE